MGPFRYSRISAAPPSRFDTSDMDCPGGSSPEALRHCDAKDSLLAQFSKQKW